MLWLAVVCQCLQAPCRRLTDTAARWWTSDVVGGFGHMMQKLPVWAVHQPHRSPMFPALCGSCVRPAESYTGSLPPWRWWKWDGGCWAFRWASVSLIAGAVTVDHMDQIWGSDRKCVCLESINSTLHLTGVILGHDIYLLCRCLISDLISETAMFKLLQWDVNQS